MTYHHPSINYSSMVFEFMRKHRQFACHYPHVIPREVAEFRIRLIEEELKELKMAMGLIDENEAIISEEQDLYLIADALADLKYVVFGTDITFGIPADSVFLEVHLSNMSKDVTHIGDTTKVRKGPGYHPPRIKPILDQAIRLGIENEKVSEQ